MRRHYTYVVDCTRATGFGTYTGTSRKNVYYEENNIVWNLIVSLKLSQYATAK